METPDTETIQVYQYEPIDKPNGWKSNMGAFGWKGDDLYFTAGAAGMSDTEAILDLIFDGEPYYFDGKLLLIPEKWARKVAPEMNDVYDAIRRRASEVQKANQADRGIQSPTP